MKDLKLSDLKPFIITKPIIIALLILILLLDFDVIHLTNNKILSIENFSDPFRTIFIVVYAVFIVGILINLLFVGYNKVLEKIGLYGMLVTFAGFIFSVSIIFPTSSFWEWGSGLLFQLSFYFSVLIILAMYIERWWYSKIITEEPQRYKEMKVKISKESKGLLKKGLKTVTKKVGEVAGDVVGDMVEDTLTEITGEKDLADVVGDLTEKGVSKLTQAGISSLTKDTKIPSKSKSLMKKGLKGVSKKVGKITGEMVGEAISDLTGDAELGDSVGKYAKKGVSILAEGVLGDKNKSSPLPTTKYETPEPIKIDYKKRLVGIIKTKKQVNMEYIESILHLERTEIIGMIYELIGKEKIEGEFNEDDSVFTLK